MGPRIDVAAFENQRLAMPCQEIRPMHKCKSIVNPATESTPILEEFGKREIGSLRYMPRISVAE